MLINKNSSGQKIFAIPVDWVVTETLEVRAESLADAVRYIKENIDRIPKGDEPEYVEGSRKISADLTGRMPVGEVVDNLIGLGYEEWDASDYFGSRRCV